MYCCFCFVNAVVVVSIVIATDVAVVPREILALIKENVVIEIIVVVAVVVAIVVAVVVVRINYRCRRRCCYVSSTVIVLSIKVSPL